MRVLLCLLPLLAACPKEDTHDSPEETGVMDTDGDGCEGGSPDATEVCDGLDNDCDGEIDEGVISTFCADVDGDGRGDGNTTKEACEAPAGYASTCDDCDDADPDAYPGANEVRDEADNDCDGDVDEACDWKDGDLDGFTGYTDCDDSDPAVHPGAEETCDGLDNDCDGFLDLVGVWDFDLGSGTVVADFSPHGLDGTLCREDAWGAGLGAGWALESGLGEDACSMSIPDDPLFAIRDRFTVEAQVTVYGSTGDSQVIVSRWENADPGGWAWSLELQPDGSTLQMPLAGADGNALCAAGASPCASTLPVPTATWTHVAGTYDATTGQVGLFVNGEPTKVSTAGGPMATVAGPTVVGASDNVHEPHPFYGLIDSLMIWCRVLSDEEILSRVSAS